MPIPEKNPRISDPKLPKDQLGSVQRQLQVHVLCEGEIEGFPSASGTRGDAVYNRTLEKDIFLNGTQLLKSSAGATATPANNKFNFNDVFTEARYGTQNQPKIKGFKDTETEFTPNLPLTSGVNFNRQIDNTVDRIRVTLQINALQIFKDDGDIVGAKVRHQIKITQSNGTVKTFVDDVISGKTPNAYFRDYMLDVPDNYAYPLILTVRRVTADSTNPKLQNASKWLRYTEIQDKADRFPNTAYVAVRVDAEQFPSTPSLMFRIRGRKIKIPHNAEVRADGSLKFTGVFNGTIPSTRVYCNDPAWVLYDLLTNERFGFGDHITEDMLDKFAFYSASVYNSERIPDNEGRNLAPRFSCNAVIQNQVDAYKLIGEICSSMRATAFYNAGTITLTQDRPTDPSYLFTLANVTEAGFSYSNSSKTIKYTMINVQYFDMETQEFDYETIEDTDLQNKYGIVVKNIKAFAITSRTQAQRLGKWFLYTQANEGEVINFVTTIEAGAIVRCGAVVKIADPVRSNKRRGGRIKSATSTTITVDDHSAATDLDDTNNPFLSVIMPDGSVERKGVQDITDGVITLDSPLTVDGVSTAPNKNSVWVLENNSLETQLFRVISVTEVKGTAYQITGVFHDNGKYDFVENDDPLEERVITTLTELAEAPTNLLAEERLVVVNNRAVSKIFITWNQVVGVNEYRVQYRFEDGNFVNTTVTKTDFEILNSSAGLYEIRVFSLNAIRRPSNVPVETTFQAQGKTAKPANVQNLRMEPVNEKLIRLRWDQSQDVDVTHGGFCRIRHSPLTDGSGTIENATDIDKLSGNSTQVVVPYVEGEYLIRFEDDTGNLSKASSSIILDLPDALGSLLVDTRREDSDSPKFQGDKNNVLRDDSLNSLRLINSATNASGTYSQSGTTVTFTISSHGVVLNQVLDITYTSGNATNGQFKVVSVPDANTFTVTAANSITTSGNVSVVSVLTGEYEFKDILDLGGVFSLDLKRHILSEGFYPNDLFDARSELIDKWDDFDGDEANNVNAELLVATTTSAPSGTNYADSDFTGKTFNTFVNGTYKARGFKFKIKLSTTDVGQNIKVSQLGYTATFQRRSEQGSARSVDGSNNAAAKDITFDKPFFVGTSTLLGVDSNLPSVGISATDNITSGDFFRVTNITSTGFTVTFRDSFNSIIDRNFNFSVVGFGKGA